MTQTGSLALGIICVVALATLLLRWRKREAAHFATRVAAVRAVLIKLAYRPDDSAAAHQLMAATADRAWLLSGDLTAKRELATRSLSLGLKHIKSASGETALSNVYRPLYLARLWDPVELARQVNEALRRPGGDDSEVAQLISFIRSLPRSTPSLDYSPSDLVREILAIAQGHVRSGAHELVLALLEKLYWVPSEQSKWLYQQVLNLLQSSRGDSALSVLALQIGRWHCGNSRPDGNVTVYDEQMIQNDIAVRSGP